MNRIALFVALMLASPAAFAKKKKHRTADTTSVSAPPATDAPSDANSKKFLARLLATAIHDFRPVDSGSVDFRYTELHFMAGNTWQAKGYVAVEDEKMDCSESGTWMMDPADSADTATISWKVDETDCPGRNPGESVRVKMTIDQKGAVSVKFR